MQYLGGQQECRIRKMKNINNTLIILIIVTIILLFTSLSSAYIMDVEPKPMYADDDFIVPLKVEIMTTIEWYQTFVIISMITVSMLKLLGMYYIMKRQDETLKFNNAYLVSAILGVFMGYAAFIPQMTYEGTYINIFMQAGFYALGANLMFDFAGKVKEKSSS